MQKVDSLTWNSGKNWTTWSKWNRWTISHKRAFGIIFRFPYYNSSVDATKLTVIFQPFYYLGSGGAIACALIGEGSVGVGVGGITFFLSMTIEKRLEPPKLYPPMLSMDFIYSDALFSIIKASSNSLTMSAMHGR